MTGVLASGTDRAGRTAAAGPRRRPPAVVLAAALPCLAALVTSLWIGINFDIRYEFGGLRVSSGVGNAYSTFVHRPLAYRLLTAALDVVPRHLFAADPSAPAAEVLLRLEATGFCAAACLLLALGLRRVVPGPVGWWVGAATLVALVLAPNWTFLEPDWVGVVWAVAAAGAALLPRRPVVGAVLAAPLVVLCTATKLTTAPYALAALGVVLLLDRRRGLAGALTSALALGVWLAATRYLMPTEWQWLRDMSRLSPGSPLRVGVRGLDWHGFAVSAANLLVVSPVVVALPASVAAIACRSRGRRAALAAVAVGVLLVTAPVLAQAEWYQYQWAGLPVLAAVLAVLALRVLLADGARPWAALAWLLGAPTAAGAASAVLLARPDAWRETHLAPVALCYAALAVLAGGGVLLALRRRTTGASSGRLRPAALAVALGVAATVVLGAGDLPSSAYALSGPDAVYTNAGLRQHTDQLRQEFAAVRQRIGPRTPVLYLAFGDVDYLLGNPTGCRFASPVWLQRSESLPYVREFATYRQNAACLTDPRARYLVLQPSWFDVGALDPALAAEITAAYDCGAADRVEGGYVLVCPRRGAAGR